MVDFAVVAKRLAQQMRLRNEMGPIFGANLDPSHPVWMGADPIAAVTVLGPAIHHGHAKDAFLNEPVAALTSRLEDGSLTDVPGRAWSCITLGYGHEEVGGATSSTGYGWLAMTAGCRSSTRICCSPIEGVRRFVDILKAAAPVEPGDGKLQAI
jgi:hypothetical protein